MKSVVHPWIGCGWNAEWLTAGACSALRSCAMPEAISCAFSGSLTMILVSGRSLRSTRPTPERVPPVP